MRTPLAKRIVVLVVVASLVASACGSGEDDTAVEQSSTTVESTATEESTGTSAEPEESSQPEQSTTATIGTTTIGTPTSSETSADSSTGTAGDGELVPIASMEPSDVEALIERIGCEIDSEFGRGPNMVAFFVGGYGPSGDAPVEVNGDMSFLCGTGGDLAVIGLSLNDATDAGAMAAWLASNDEGSCREVGYAGSWTFLYATSEDPPDAVRLAEVLALYGGEMERVCPYP